MLSVEDVASHFGLRPDTIRRKIRTGEINAIRIGRVYRLAWPDVWAAVEGPMPKRARIPRYQNDPICKKAIAGALWVSVRTVERWIDKGLPTRNVFGAVRCNPHHVTDWLKLRGIDPPRGLMGVTAACSSHRCDRHQRDTGGLALPVAHRPPNINRRYAWGRSCETRENSDAACEPPHQV